MAAKLSSVTECTIGLGFAVANGMGKGRSMRTRLKLFVGDDEQQNTESTETPGAMPLEEFARVIADAVTWERTWLRDFADEQVVVSQDLYEVLKMYDEVRQARA